MVSSPELRQLAAGDVEWQEEIYPVDGLAAGRRGEGAAVGGVLLSVSRHQGGFGQPPEPHLGPLLLDLGQSRNQGGQGSIVLGLIIRAVNGSSRTFTVPGVPEKARIRALSKEIGKGKLVHNDHN